LKLSLHYNKDRIKATGKDLAISVMANVITAIIAVLFGYILYKINSKPFYAGKFTAYEIYTDCGDEAEWGELMLTYNLLNKKVKGILKHKSKNITIKINGTFERERYLVGTYIENSRPSRLRLGSFIMTINPEGDIYEGSFLHLSPTTGYENANLGKARWEKVKN
jgi:hypothetical protein